MSWLDLNRCISMQQYSQSHTHAIALNQRPLEPHCVSASASPPFFPHYSQNALLQYVTSALAKTSSQVATSTPLMQPPQEKFEEIIYTMNTDERNRHSHSSFTYAALDAQFHSSMKSSIQRTLVLSSAK